MPFSLRLTALEFTDRSVVQLSPGEILVVVGPNNSGKSTLLREIMECLQGNESHRVLVRAVEYEVSGTESDFRVWLNERTEFGGRDENLAYHRGPYKLFARSLPRQFSDLTNHRGDREQIANILCRHLTATDRIEIATKPDNSFDAVDLVATTPIQLIFKNERLEREISTVCRRYFGQDLVVHRVGGRHIPLYWGARPEPENGEDRMSRGYLDRIERLPRLAKQGDGVRSFVGTLLWSALGRHCVLLVDEPEAFLHPPQARALSRVLCEMGVGVEDEQQVVMATHSADVLRGLLEAPTTRKRVIRIARNADESIVSELTPDDLASLWADPMVRHSGVFDGIFHELVVLCESDVDCSFYQSVFDHLPFPDPVRRPDVLFTPVSGKSAFKKVLPALVGLGVPVRVVCDFDTLNNSDTLATLVTSLGGDWKSLAADWRIVDNAARQAGSSPPSRTKVREALDRTAQMSKGDHLSPEAVDAVNATLKSDTGWRFLKRAGMHGLPSGDGSAAFLRLNAKLCSLGVFVVPVGELEAFDRTVPGHGSAWLRELAARHPDVASSPAHAAAAVFVAALVGVAATPAVLASSPRPSLLERAGTIVSTSGWRVIRHSTLCFFAGMIWANVLSFVFGRLLRQ